MKLLEQPTDALSLLLCKEITVGLICIEVCAIHPWIERLTASDGALGHRHRTLMRRFKVQHIGERGSGSNLQC